MRAVLHARDLPEAHARCMSEAQGRLRRRGRVRRAADAQRAPHRGAGAGRRPRGGEPRRARMLAAAALPEAGGDRAQPRRSPTALRERLTQAALAMAQAVRYRSLGTFEFLVDERSRRAALRLHRGQPAPAGRAHGHRGGDRARPGAAADRRGGAGSRWRTLGIDADRSAAAAAAIAIQWRINAETLDAQGHARPSGGTLARFDLPAGPGIRVDTHGYAGLRALAALRHAARQADRAHAPRRASPTCCAARCRALAECAIEGVATNLALLRAIARAARVRDARRCTRASSRSTCPTLLAAAARIDATARERRMRRESTDARRRSRTRRARRLSRRRCRPGWCSSRSTVGDVRAGRRAARRARGDEDGAPAACAARPARVIALLAAPGDYLVEGAVAACGWSRWTRRPSTRGARRASDLDAIRPDLQKVIDRHAYTLDANRGAARREAPRAGRPHRAREHRRPVRPAEARQLQRIRRARGRRADAPPHARRPDRQHAGRRHGDRHRQRQRAGSSAPRSRAAWSWPTTTPCWPARRACATTTRPTACSGIAHQLKLPVVLFAEGGGGRPGDTDMPIVAGLQQPHLQPVRARCRARCRWSASCTAAASRATRRCWAAPT